MGWVLPFGKMSLLGSHDLTHHTVLLIFSALLLSLCFLSCVHPLKGVLVSNHLLGQLRPIQPSKKDLSGPCSTPSLSTSSSDEIDLWWNLQTVFLRVPPTGISQALKRKRPNRLSVDIHRDK